jgi:hypothetical protein
VGIEPLELLERLAALVPPPRFNLVRYHGVLAPAAKGRAAVVARRPSVGAGSTTVAGCDCAPGLGGMGERGGERKSGTMKAAEVPGTGRRRPRNYSWAELMRRVFEVDVLECPACHGRMRILAAIHPPEATRAILECLGLPTRAPPLVPAACVPTDPELDF